MRRFGERSHPLACGRIGVERSFDLAPLRHLEFGIQIADETVVTALLHSWYSYAPRGRPRAAAVTRYGPVQDGS